jgi:hypothetical protein
MLVSKGVTRGRWISRRVREWRSMGNNTLSVFSFFGVRGGEERER